MLLLDLGMPRMDGRAVMREVWADKRLRHIPVIILTGSERENDLIDAYKRMSGSSQMLVFNAMVRLAADVDFVPSRDSLTIRAQRRRFLGV